jgi:hypothetical protein
VLRRGLYRARFVSPAAGFLTVVWRAHVSIRQGKHVRHVTLVIARGVAHTPTTGSAMLTIRLTAAGKRILRADPFHLHVIASERFLAPGVGWTSLTKRFIL